MSIQGDTLELAVTHPEVQQFDAARTKHPHYSDTFKRTWTLATQGRASRVVIVAGPTGVGKSTLGASLLQQARKATQDECTVDPSLVPAALVKAIAPQGRSFSWKDFYIRALEQLREPLVERKVWTPQQYSLLGPEVIGRTGADSLNVEILRRSLENAIRRRKTRFLIVDEAHHMLLCHDDRQLALQFETLKSLADMCNATLVLLGTYKLLMIRDYSAQLIRRSQIVHFPSYQLGAKEDRKAFKSVLLYFAGKLPIPLCPRLNDDVQFFFGKTAGCIGILHDLLRDALQEALDDGATEITKEMVDRVAQPNRAIQTILQESAQGVVALEDVPVQTIEAMLKQSPAEIVADRAKMLSTGSDFEPWGNGPRHARSVGAPGRKLPVGQRKPSRDHVGGPRGVDFR